ncbi:MAG TPA: hypothetical protein DDZ80_10230, partial [Cyanobacteria bacterium UBA8803]|nr:hypothetical protein [Cyanobacteria bacterium UBA8803]
GQTLVSGGGDGLITLWPLYTSEPPLTLTGNLSSICSLAISLDGEIVAAGCIDGNLKLWHLGTAALCNILPCYSGPVMSALFNLEGRTLIGCSAGDTIKIWQIPTGELLGVLNTDSPSSVTSVTISPNGQWIAAGSEDGSVKIWGIGNW